MHFAAVALALALPYSISAAPYPKPQQPAATSGDSSECRPNGFERFNLGHHHDINTGRVIIGNTITPGFARLPGGSGCSPQWAGGSYDDSQYFQGGKYPDWLIAKMGGRQGSSGGESNDSGMSGGMAGMSGEKVGSPPMNALVGELRRRNGTTNAEDVGDVVPNGDSKWAQLTAWAESHGWHGAVRGPEETTPAGSSN